MAKEKFLLLEARTIEELGKSMQEFREGPEAVHIISATVSFSSMVFDDIVFDKYIACILYEPRE